MPKVAKEEKARIAVKYVEESESTVMIEVPLSEPVPSSFPIHVDLQLSREVATALRRMARAYDRQQATLSNGMRIVSPTQALRKILEQIAEAS